MMNGWFLAAGALLFAAFFVHSFRGNKLYAAARPDRSRLRACDAWLMGRCGMQLIGVDLLLAAGALLSIGSGLLPRSRALESFLWLTYCGWTVGWLLSLAAERAQGRDLLRLCQWVLFLIVAILTGIGIFG